MADWNNWWNNLISQSERESNRTRQAGQNALAVLERNNALEKQRQSQAQAQEQAQMQQRAEASRRASIARRQQIEQRQADEKRMRESVREQVIKLFTDDDKNSDTYGQLLVDKNAIPYLVESQYHKNMLLQAGSPEELAQHREQSAKAMEFANTYQGGVILDAQLREPPSKPSQLWGGVKQVFHTAEQVRETIDAPFKIAQTAQTIKVKSGVPNMLMSPERIQSSNNLTDDEKKFMQLYFDYDQWSNVGGIFQPPEELKTLWEEITPTAAKIAEEFVTPSIMPLYMIGGGAAGGLKGVLEETSKLAALRIATAKKLGEAAIGAKVARGAIETTRAFVLPAVVVEKIFNAPFVLAPKAFRAAQRMRLMSKWNKLPLETKERVSPLLEKVANRGTLLPAEMDKLAGFDKKFFDALVKVWRPKGAVPIAGVSGAAAKVGTKTIPKATAKTPQEIAIEEAARLKAITPEAPEYKMAQETIALLKKDAKAINIAAEAIEGKTPAQLRQTIMAWGKVKGLPKVQLGEIIKKISGHTRLTMAKEEYLKDILKVVKATRPRRVRGRPVVTLKTEKKIQTLRTTLIRNKEMTEGSFDHLVKQLNLRTVKYENQYRFITEGEAKSLIRAMNDEAPLAKEAIETAEALGRSPKLKAVVDRLNARNEGAVIDGVPIKVSRGNELKDMRYYVMNLQCKMKAPVYDYWQRINMGHLRMRHKQQVLIDKLEQSTPMFKQIQNDEVALKRVENYIASKHHMGPKVPKDITPDEVKLATELERQLFGFRNDVRYARFTEAYIELDGDVARIAREIPDASTGALKRAVDVYEGRGARELRIFLDTQEWGVQHLGYNPLSIVKPRLYLLEQRATTFAKGHLKVKRGVEYTQEDKRDILSRYRSYTKQMHGLTELSPLVRSFDRMFGENAHKITDAQTVANTLSLGINELKGYRVEGGLIVHGLNRLYAQVASAVFWRPDLVLRNKFQNLAFNSDFHLGLFLRYPIRKLSAEEEKWFDIFVSQQSGMRQDYLLYSQKPLWGFGKISEAARKTSLYPWADRTNRLECFYVRMRRAEDAVVKYRKTGNVEQLIKDSGINEFEARQQAEALELLAKNSVDYGIEGMGRVTGEKAFIRYNAQQHTNNVHFLYDRAQRAPAEMGATGKTLGNILVFTRSWGQRFYLQGRKITDPKIGIAEKLTSLRVITGTLVAGILAGEGYKQVTGKTHNPYNPLNILTWAPGGLIVGVADDISSTMYLITQAAQGDKAALGSLPIAITGCADMCLPFYKNTIQALDALKDKKNIDVYALRRVREMIDNEYHLRGGAYKVDRAWLEALQHALLAGKEKPETPEEKKTQAQNNALSQMLYGKDFKELSSSQTAEIEKYPYLLAAGK